MTRDEINAFGEAVKKHLLSEDDCFLVAVGAHGYDTDTGDESVSVTLRGRVKNEDREFSCRAVELYTALTIARRKFREARDKKDEE